MKTRIEVEIPEKIDPFDALTRLKKVGKVMRANLIKVGLICIYYDNRKTTEEEIKKYIGC